MKNISAIHPAIIENTENTLVKRMHQRLNAKKSQSVLDKFIERIKFRVRSDVKLLAYVLHQSKICILGM